MSEVIKKCPFCGGKARVSCRQKRYLGMNELGEKKIEFAHQVICNSCHARGPLVTHTNYTGHHKNVKAMEASRSNAIYLWYRAWGYVMDEECSKCYR